MRKLLVFLIAIALLAFGLYWTMGELLWPQPVISAKLLLAGVFPMLIGGYLLWADFIAPALGIKTGEDETRLGKKLMPRGFTILCLLQTTLAI
jgi:hypothetical protein